MDKVSLRHALVSLFEHSSWLALEFLPWQGAIRNRAESENPETWKAVPPLELESSAGSSVSAVLFISMSWRGVHDYKSLGTNVVWFCNYAAVIKSPPNPNQQPGDILPTLGGSNYISRHQWETSLIDWGNYNSSFYLKDACSTLGMCPHHAVRKLEHASPTVLLMQRSGRIHETVRDLILSNTVIA